MRQKYVERPKYQRSASKKFTCNTSSLIMPAVYWRNRFQWLLRRSSSLSRRSYWGKNHSVSHLFSGRLNKTNQSSFLIRYINIHTFIFSGIVFFWLQIRNFYGRLLDILTKRIMQHSCCQIYLLRLLAQCSNAHLTLLYGMTPSQSMSCR